MNRRDLNNLLNRAAAALETPADLSPNDRASLAEDLVEEAKMVSEQLIMSVQEFNALRRISQRESLLKYAKKMRERGANAEVAMDVIHFTNAFFPELKPES